MSYLEELQALTQELASLNERIRTQYGRRGLPSYVSLLNIERADDELATLMADWHAYCERWAVFAAKYYASDADPDAVE
jgi:hypothetical protein